MSTIHMTKSVKSKLNEAVLSSKNVEILGPKDIGEVNKLFRQDKEHYYRNLFGNHSAHQHLTKRYISLGVYTDDHDLAGVISFDSYPNVPALPSWEWNHWLYHHYEIDYMLPISTIWIYYAIWDFRYTWIFAKPILEYLFENHETLQYAVMVCPPGITSVEFLDNIAERRAPIGQVNVRKVQSLFICKREDFVCQYTIRRAVEEDNDDLVEIIPKVLEDTYGQYYISELLSFPDLGRQIIVAEYKGCAVGVLCLNEEVNYDLLNEEFHLIPFNGFKKPDQRDEIDFTKHDSSTVTEESEKDPVVDEYTVDLNFKNEITSVESDEKNELNSEDEYSLVSLNSSLIFDLHVEEVDLKGELSDSDASVNSAFSTLLLNSDGEYADHLNESSLDSDVIYTDKRRHDEAMEIPTFYGEPNAFSIEISAVLGDHESCLYLLFQAAFQCFPDRDYIVVSFPPNSCQCYLMKHFTRVIPRRTSRFEHELYCLHRNSILGIPSVRVATPQDKAAVRELVKTMDKPYFIEEKFKEAVDFVESPYKAYVLCCENQIVGSAVVAEESDQEYLELYYDLESWICTQYTKFGMYGSIDHFIVSPIFHRQVNFFLRELHRLSNFYVCFYRINSHEAYNTYKKIPILNAVINMAPILPNPRTHYDSSIYEAYNLPDAMTAKRTPYSLYLSTPRITGNPRLEITQRIVVVGASVTAISFLESLLFSRNPKCLVTFCNVTLVTLQSLYQKRGSRVHDMAFVSDGHLDHRYLSSICLRTYVHMINNVMTKIDRKEKLVYFSDQTCIPYDYLFLMCGQQFQKPTSIVGQRHTEFPQNVFIVNTEADAITATTTLKNLISVEKSHTVPLVVVYGHYLEALCFLALLMEFGLSAQSLIYVDPSPVKGESGDSHVHLTNFFNNKDVEMTIMKEMLNLGITIYQNFKFIEWTQDRKQNFITSAKFESQYKMIDIELTALVLYDTKAVSMKTFQAMHRSGLVVNGHLVINKQCQTNDPYIYAAGPLTMYSQKFHAEHLMHQYFNGQEIGYKLGQQIRKKLIKKSYWDYPIEEPLRHKPIVHYCKFPGKLYYLNVFKPGKPIPLDLAMAKSSYGIVMTTGDLNDLSKQPYFRLHFNQYDTVETITCLSKQEFNVDNLIAIYGKHESLFNNICQRYCQNMIPDLYEYFKQPWLTAIYHPKFNNVLTAFEEMWASLKTDKGVPLVEAIKTKLAENNWNILSNVQEDEIVEICENTSYFRIVEQTLLNFLQQNRMYLPMYVTQMLIRWIQHDIASSQLFVKCTKTMNFGAPTSVKGFHPKI